MTNETANQGETPFNVEEWYMGRTTDLANSSSQINFDRLGALNNVHKNATLGKYDFPLSQEALDREVGEELRRMVSMSPSQEYAHSMKNEGEFIKYMARRELRRMKSEGELIKYVARSILERIKERKGEGRR